MPSSNLEAFIALSREGNFTKAAKSLGLSQPAFSQRVLALESFLETTLVIREKRGIALTEAGQKLLRYCNINHQIETEFLNDIIHPGETSALRGQIRLGGFSSVMRSLLLPSLAPLLRQNQELSAHTFTAELSETLPLLQSSKADFILHNQEQKKEVYECVFLGFEEYVMVSSKENNKSDIYLDHDENDLTTSAYFQMLEQNPPNKRRYLDDIYGLLDGVRLGLGNAVLPKHLINDKSLMIKRPLSVLKTPVYLVYYKASYYTRLQQEIIKAINSHFRTSLAQS